MTEINVILPVHNQAYPLSLTLGGFARQTIPSASFRLIIVDDGSEEPVGAVAEAYNEQLRITYIRIPKSGRAAARNAGVELVDEGLVIFCDADRIPRPGFIEGHVKAHGQAHGQADGQAHGRQGERLSVGQVRELYIPDPEHKRELVLQRFDQGKYDRIPQFCRLVYRLFRDDGLTDSAVAWIAALSGNMAIPAGLFRQLGGFDEQFREWGFEHMEFGYRAHLAGIPFVYAKEAVNVHVAHPRRGASYAEYIRQSHAYFYRKHPHPVIGCFQPFMMGRISRLQLEAAAATGIAGEAGISHPDDYVRILNFKP
ncbi:glycosyltransferase [Paenibacillus sp. N10]|uniref:Glycosyltransferase n=1 Tax=Paenibacillus lutrae TaxID=2078573 RepID=A0A7X3JYC9_9BACL|nr:glycosyltransferase [Paenibacillus lutrae]